MKHRLWLMAGIPGSGKSTWIKEHLNWFSDSCEVISRDEIRFSLLEEGDEYFSKENEVVKEFFKRIKNSLINNVDTIVDATHINEASRSRILVILNSDKNLDFSNIEINVIFIKVSLELALFQNGFREGIKNVPEDAIKRMFMQSSDPSLKEGFDNIYIYNKINVSQPKYEIINKEIKDENYN